MLLHCFAAFRCNCYSATYSCATYVNHIVRTLTIYFISYTHFCVIIYFIFDLIVLFITIAYVFTVALTFFWPYAADKQGRVSGTGNRHPIPTDRVPAVSYQ